MLLLLILLLLDEREISGMSHFNDVDFRVFFNILKVVYKFGHSGIP